jgi:hypothetical protein
MGNEKRLGAGGKIKKALSLKARAILFAVG